MFTATPAELADWCRDGRVTDAKTLTAMLWLQNVLSGAWALDWKTAEAHDAADLPDNDAMKVLNLAVTAATASRAGSAPKTTSRGSSRRAWSNARCAATAASTSC